MSLLTKLNLSSSVIINIWWVVQVWDFRSWNQSCNIWKEHSNYLEWLVNQKSTDCSFYSVCALQTGTVVISRVWTFHKLDCESNVFEHTWRKYFIDYFFAANSCSLQCGTKGCWVLIPSRAPLEASTSQFICAKVGIFKCLFMRWCSFGCIRA